MFERVAPAGSGRTCVSAAALFPIDADDYLHVEALQQGGATVDSALWVAPL